MKQLNNKKGMTLIEIILVVWIILWLLAWLASSLWGTSSKQKDTWRIKVLQEYMTYYDSVKQSIWQYPWEKVKGSWTVKDLAKALPNGEILYSFTEQDSDWYYTSWDWWDEKSWNDNLKNLQDLLVATKDLWAPWSIKAGFPDEGIIIFTSTSQKRAVGCVKLYWTTEASLNDWDWIPDTNTWANEDKNGWRIFVTWDMWLWKQNQAAYSASCQWLPDPASL